MIRLFHELKEFCLEGGGGRRGDLLCPSSECDKLGEGSVGRPKFPRRYRKLLCTAEMPYEITRPLFPFYQTRGRLDGPTFHLWIRFQRRDALQRGHLIVLADYQASLLNCRKVLLIGVPELTINIKLLP